MSGFEIAGIVLAVFPVVVKGVSKLSTAAEAGWTWDAKRYQANIEMILSDIQVEEAIFRDTYLSLLLTVLPPSDVMRTLADPLRPSREESNQIQNALKARLGPRWTHFDRVMFHLENTIKTLQMVVDKVC